ncbi:MAG: von Willebrand factor type A domain-containing protein [Verrucomicrobiota bacterium]
MNPDQPSREQIETRITALLLGELPADEAALLRYTMAQDPALQRLHDELQSTLVLVREAARNPEEPTIEKAAPLELSAERRQKLLAHFKTPRPKADPPQPLFWLKPINVSPLIKMLAAAAILAVLAVMLLPALSTAKRKSQRVDILGAGRREEMVARLQEMENTPAKANIAPAATAPKATPFSTSAQIILPVAQSEPGQLAEDNDLLARGTAVGAQSRAPVLLSPQEIASQITAPKTSPVYSQNIAGYVNVPRLGKPEEVSLTPEPKLAAPPTSIPNTQIVLPQTETAPAVAAQTGAKEKQEEGGVYSQSIVGYVNVPIPNNAIPNNAVEPPAAAIESSAGNAAVTPPPATPTATQPAFALGGGAIATDKVEAHEPAQKQWIVPGQGQPESSELAINKEANGQQLGAVSGNANAFGGISGSGGGGGGAAGTTRRAFEQRLAGVSTAASADKADEGSLIDAENNDLVRAQRPKVERPKEEPLQMKSAEKKVPLLGDVPVGGSLFPIAAPPSTMPPANPGLPQVTTAAPAPMVAGGAIGTQQNFTTSPNQNSAPTQRQIYNAPADTTGLGGQAPSKELAFAPGTSSSLEPDSGPASGDRNRFLGRYAYIPPVSSFSELTQSTNFVVLNGSAANTFNPGVAGAAPIEGEMIQPGLTDFEGAKKNSYEDAKRELDQKKEMHRLLYAKLEEEKVDLTLPKNSLVQLTDPARPSPKQSFWQHLTGRYESTARMKVENDVTDIPGMSGRPSYMAYDPYFIQTTFEIIKSPILLSNVVNALDLQNAWSKKYGGQKLTTQETISLLQNELDLHPVKNTKLVEIGVTSDDPKEASDIANAVAEAYKDYRFAARRALSTSAVAVLEEQFQEQEQDIRTNAAYVEQLRQELHVNGESAAPAQASAPQNPDLPVRKPAPNAPVPQPEILTSSNAFSTFALNVSDVSFKLAEASLQNNKLPDTASIRSEEFINAFDYRDPEAAEGQPMAFASERARYPFAHNRELLRFALKTAAAGRQQGRALNLVLLLDVSGSMERADRVAIIHEALRVLATQLQPQDTVSVVTFARTARLWADGLSGDKAGDTLDQVGGITPEGGTNLEEAMRLAYETAHRHYLAAGINRVVLLTDGAANLGNVEPETLKQKVEAQRKQGIALDCFGIGWEDYNDDLLELLSSNGDGRYAFIYSPEDASKDFAAKLAGALQIAAADVKVQVEFNPARVISYRQIGYATHQLTKEQFRDNTVAAGEIAAQEAGNALYTVETNPGGEGPIATVHVRYRIPGTADYREHSWDVAYTGNAPALDQSSPGMRLAATASAFSEWLAASPYAQEVTLDDLLRILSGVPQIYGADDRPQQLETMIREAKTANYEPQKERTSQGSAF